MPPCPKPVPSSTTEAEVKFDDDVAAAEANLDLAPDTRSDPPNKDPISYPPAKKRAILTNHLHWELNLYSFSTLGLIYMLLPEQHKGFMRFVFGLIAVDVSRYYCLKGSLAGVPYTLPMMTIFAMSTFPVPFWTEIAHIAMASECGICTNQLMGKFMVFCTDPDTCRQILTGEGTFEIYAHPNSKWLFGPKNLIYLDNEAHKAIRRILSPALFSDEALEQYAKCQATVVRQFMSLYANQCKESGESIDLRVAFRSMSAAASQESFLGPYLNDKLRVHLEQDILTFTMGFLCPPTPYVGGLKSAIQAKDRIEQTIQNIVPMARQYILDGNQPRCLLERWSKSIIDTAKESGVLPQNVPGCQDDDVARSVLDFLFAAQDATNSALTYAADVMESRPDVMTKISHEAHAALREVRHGHYKSLKLYDMNALCYTRHVANHLLHLKPPVPMVPHISKRPSYLGGHYIPTGTIAIPSLFYSARVSGYSTTEFYPERKDADSQFLKCMTFGAGQHKCPGRRYAESLVVVFMAILASEFRLERCGERPGVDDFIYFPTHFPSRSDFLIHAKE